MNSRLKETMDFFDKKAELWDTETIYNPDLIKTIVELAGISENDKIVDIACGTGILFNDILAKKPSRLWGVDLSEKMLEKAAKKFDCLPVRLWAGDFLNFPESNFDRAFIYRAYPHFPDKRAFAEKLCSILRKNGRFIIAHSESRYKINRRHIGTASNVFDILLPAEKETEYFKSLFDIDIIADTDYIYIISGKKK